MGYFLLLFYNHIITHIQKLSTPKYQFSKNFYFFIIKTLDFFPIYVILIVTKKDEVLYSILLKKGGLIHLYEQEKCQKWIKKIILQTKGKTTPEQLKIIEKAADNWRRQHGRSR